MYFIYIYICIYIYIYINTRKIKPRNDGGNITVV